MNVNFYNRIQQMKNGGAAPASPGAPAPQQPSAINKPDISYIVYHSLVSSLKGMWGGAKLEAHEDTLTISFGKLDMMDTKVAYSKTLQRFLYILQLNHINYKVDQTTATIRVHTNPPDPRLNIPNPQDYIQEFVFIPEIREGVVSISTDEEHKDTLSLIIKYVTENEKSV